MKGKNLTSTRIGKETKIWNLKGRWTSNKSLSKAEQPNLICQLENPRNNPIMYTPESSKISGTGRTGNQLRVKIGVKDEGQNKGD